MKPSSNKNTSVFPHGHINRSNWKRVKLGDVLSYEQPYPYIVKDTEYADAGIPVLTPGKTFILGYTHEATGVCQASYQAPKILFDDFLTISRLVEFDFKVKSSAVKILSPTSNEYNLRYLFYAMSQLRFEVVDHQRHWIGQFAKLEIAIPSRKEQDKISDALLSCEKHITAIQDLITKYEAIKKATVNLLLKPEVGWRKVKIKDFCPLQRGFDLPKRLRSEGRYPLVCSNGIVDRIDTALQKAPGVVTGRSGTIGSVHYVTEDYWPHNTTLWVTKFIDADPMFVYHLLSNMNLSSFSGGSGVPTLNRNSIHETIISVPAIHKQREIALQISAIDNVLKDRRVLLAKAQSLKQGMMSYFFG